MLPDALCAPRKKHAASDIENRPTIERRVCAVKEEIPICFGNLMVSGVGMMFYALLSPFDRSYARVTRMEEDDGNSELACQGREVWRTRLEVCL